MGKIIDRTGQKYGKLTFVKYSYTKDKAKHWLIRCDCGNERIFRSGDVVSGKVESCGCIFREKRDRRKKEIINQKYGRLTPIEYKEDYNWLCKCDCGAEKVALQSLLLNGSIKSCGCLYKETRKTTIDMTGKKYNQMTFINHVKGPNWLCKCDCGNEKIVRGSNVTQGLVKTCGCLNKRSLIGKKYNNLTFIKHLKGKEWQCKCDCGNDKILSQHSVIRGDTKSCSFSCTIKFNRINRSKQSK